MTARITYSFLFALLIFALRPVYAQVERHYSFENYSNKEGLDQNTIWAIEQDTYGMFWLGTANGLIKYDGSPLQNSVSKSPPLTNTHRAF